MATSVNKILFIEYWQK